MLWVILLAAGGIMLILLYTRIYVFVTAEYNHNKPLIVMRIRLYRIQVLRKEFNLRDLEKTDKWKDVYKNKKYSDKLKKVQNEVKNFIQMASTAKTGIFILLSRLQIHQFKWITLFGTGEASETGIAAGGLWSLKNVLASLLDNLSNLKCKPVLNITPLFQGKQFNSKIDCIVSIRVGQAMLALIRMVRHLSFRKKEITA